MVYLTCTFKRKGMQCKARRAAQGGPLSKRRNAAMRPFSLEPFGQSDRRTARKPAACRVAAPCRSTTTSRRRALHSAGLRGCVHIK